MMYDRLGGSRVKPKIMKFPAPSKGWVRNENLQTASKNAAEVLDNIFPTTEGARLRKGSTKHATITDAAKQIMPFQSAGASALFAATATDIYEVTSPADADVAETAKMSNLTSGDWAYTQFSTSAGDYLFAVNGADYATYYGTSLEPIADEAINELTYDALTGEFTPGLTVTGGTSGATATIFAVEPLTATTGVLKVGTVTGGPFQNNEALTDSSTGAATEDGTIVVGSAIAITGVATTALSHVWASHQRLFFIEKDTLNAWYLATSSIGGTATEIPLGPVFNHGGSLLFGATWSLDSGSGQDDVCIFVTDQGEVAVYSGINPATASTWVLVGVYKMGKPLNKHSSFKAGGDVAVMTEDGIVPISAAIRKDRAALQADAITYNIEEAWQEAIRNRSAAYPFTATLWQSATMLIIGAPSLGSENIAYVANARTGAWCRFVGWDIQCSGIYDDSFYFGTETGEIVQGEVSGTDQDMTYIGRWVPKFNDNNDPSCKVAVHARLRTRTESAFTPSIQAFADYTIGDYNSSVSTLSTVGDVWGTGVWGTATWSGGNAKISQSEWESVTSIGTALAPVFQVASNNAVAPSVEFIVGELVYEAGSPI